MIMQKRTVGNLTTAVLLSGFSTALLFTFAHPSKSPVFSKSRTYKKYNRENNMEKVMDAIDNAEMISSIIKIME